jgi:hypothetical protein
METQLKRKLAPKVNSYLFGVGIVVIFMGIILGAQLLGLWSTTGRVTPSGAPVEIKGSDPAEIKGWMKLEDISTAYKIPLSEMLLAFKLPADTPGSAAIKDLEGQGENFSATSLRTWVAQRLGVTLIATTFAASSGTPKSGTGSGSSNKAPGATPPAKP